MAIVGRCSKTSESRETLNMNRRSLFFTTFSVALLLIGAKGPGPLEKKRIADNLQIITENLAKLRQNQGAANEDIAILESELKDLAALEARYTALQKKYESYLKKPATNPTPPPAPKESRVRQFLDLVEKNLSDAQSRTTSKTAELAKLKARQEEYTRLISEEQRKQVALKKLSVPPGETPAQGTP